MKVIIPTLLSCVIGQYVYAQFPSSKLENKNGLYLYNEKVITRQGAFTMLKKNKDSKTAFYISRTENYLGFSGLIASAVVIGTLATRTDTEQKYYRLPLIGVALNLGLLLDSSNHLQKSIKQFNNGISSTSERRRKINWSIGIGYCAVQLKF